MNKEEQIKRLAQNLFKNGFTKSMDYAIQTAAGMLGFPDSLVTNELMTEEESKYGGKSLLNADRDMSESNTSHKEKSDEVVEYSRDFAKKLSQSMAEERVYSQIPGTIRAGISSSENITQKPDAASSSQNTQDSAGEDFLSSSTHAEGDAQNRDDEAIVLDYSSGMEGQDNNRESDRASKHSHDYETSVSDDNSLEDSSFLSELREEEQTSLISGYMSSAKEDFISGGDEGYSTPSYSHDGSQHQNDVLESENIFKGADYKIRSESRGSEMDDTSVGDNMIKSRFPVEFDSDEDFLTPVLQSRNDSAQGSYEQQQDPQRAPQQAPRQTTSNAGSTGTAQATQSNAAEAGVDITKMFHFSNMRG